MLETQSLTCAVLSGVGFCGRQGCLLTPEGSWDSGEGQHLTPGNAMPCCPMRGNISPDSPIRRTLQEAIGGSHRVGCHCSAAARVRAIPVWEGLLLQAHGTVGTQ